MTINNNTSSILAHQDLLGNSAHNIANSTTDNFSRQDTSIVDDAGSVKAVSSTIENQNPYSNTDLTKEMTDQIVAYQAVGANVVAIRAKEETQRTLLEMYA